MFDYSLAHWATYLTAAVLLNISPGPDMAFILGQTAKGGIKSGFAAMFGIWTGALIHVVFAALGLSAILVTSAVAFSTVKWIGAAYLIWLGIQALKSKGSNISVREQESPKGLRKVFKQGVLVAVLNPKVAVFFFAFLPQFVEVGAGPVSAQLFFHGILIIAVAGLIEPPLILIGGKLTAYLNENTKLSCWLDRGLGALFIWLGIKLATID
ncbi:amino acid efflux protein [Deferribacter desulfuricans SSM1]|uniref:Amino acid efflux protein n=1 Tax=Deferribacter desulfuricans (strain DSM 14783 / JCM 11476 / NBRC 101012 / SSM1) TaxID=639282 RepID=D3PCM8_DEFDS|nr:LysE family translocator [Deferribacter desulfuricans]BAI80351.1 amino acid efflux protein [Deferribacter desulfuricans SSM1]